MCRLLLLAACFVTLALDARGQTTAFLGRPANQWTRELADQRPATRRSAAFALGRIGSAALPATPELANCLHDSDASVRAMSAEALGDIVLALHGGGLSIWEAAGPALGKALADDADPRVRAAAAYALGAFGDRASSLAPALRAALHDAEPRVRRGAARALGRLSEGANDAVKDLCDLLKDSELLVRRDAVTALGSIGTPAAHAAVRPLLALVKVETDGVVRRTALDKLVGLVGREDRSAAADLYPALRGDDVDAARSAAFALANIGGPDATPAVPILQQALQEENDSLQALAAAALGVLGPEAAPAVIDLARVLTQSKNAAARLNAARALGQIGPKARDAVPLLIKALAPAELHEVRMLAAEAIMKIGSPGNDDAVPALLQIVESDADPTLRHHSAWCVAQRVDHESNGISKTFAKVIEETDPATVMLRYEAAWHLAAHLRDKAPDRTVDILYDLFRDRRVTAASNTSVKVSGSGGEAEGGRVEVTAVRPTGISSIQIEAARALGFLGAKANRPEIVKALREAKKENDIALQKAVTEALERITR
jgi:HEAT repeat protein